MSSSWNLKKNSPYFCSCFTLVVPSQDCLQLIIFFIWVLKFKFFVLLILFHRKESILMGHCRFFTWFLLISSNFMFRFSLVFFLGLLGDGFFRLNALFFLLLNSPWRFRYSLFLLGNNSFAFALGLLGLRLFLGRLFRLFVYLLFLRNADFIFFRLFFNHCNLIKMNLPAKIILCALIIFLSGN